MAAPGSGGCSSAPWPRRSCATPRVRCSSRGHASRRYGRCTASRHERRAPGLRPRCDPPGRATRAYTSQPVAKSQVLQLLDAAVHAPTAIHLEPWAFVVVQDRAVLERICERAKALAQTLQGAQHRFLADPSFHIFYNAGTLVVICGKPLGPFVVADCWLAAENLMIAATALGLATCPIGFAVPALADPELKSELGIPPEVTAIAPIIVGYSAATPAAASRRPPEILGWK